MRNSVLIFIILTTSFALYGQKPATQSKPKAAKTVAPKKSVDRPQKNVQTAKPTQPSQVNDKEKFAAAIAINDPTSKIAALRKFIKDFPKSSYRERALESLVVARAELADEKLLNNLPKEAVKLFGLAVDEMPSPISDRLFSQVVSKFPANLFYGNQREASFSIAKAIEKKIANNPRQFLGLAGFYLGTESGDEATRLVEKSISLDPNLAEAYQTLGYAKRLNFDLPGALAAFQKSLELDPASKPAMQSVADMHRALGKYDQAEPLYRALLTDDAANLSATTGLVLSLFGSGKITEAERSLSDALSSNPTNLNLLTASAYWFAVNKAPDRAIEMADKVIELEPRYIWAHIAKSRALLANNRPIEAERVLVMARQYGNFPTIDYEIALARMDAGFFREAAEGIQKNFGVKDGVLRVRLGGRVTSEANTFSDLLRPERSASILEFASGDDSRNSEKLKTLIEFEQSLSEAKDETSIGRLADNFVAGDDSMKVHRQLYIANSLLKKGVAVPKASEIIKASVAHADAGLSASSASSAVMASELYESRELAFARNEIILVPEVPRPTLSSILRGRIEELAGWSSFLQQDYPDAIMRLRRSISVLPAKSAWWRTSTWRLGAALAANGQDKEALEKYIESYKADKPSVYRYGEIAAVYRRVHGNTTGLEDLIGANPLDSSQAVQTGDRIPQATQAASTPEPNDVSTPITQKPVVSESQPAVTNAESSTIKSEPDPQVAAKADEEKKNDSAEALAPAAPQVSPSPQPTVERVAAVESKPTEPVGESKVELKPVPGSQKKETETAASENPPPQIEKTAEKVSQQTTLTESPKPASETSTEPIQPTDSGLNATTQPAAKEEPKNLLRDPLSPDERKETIEPIIVGRPKPVVVVEDKVGSSPAKGEGKELFEPVVINVAKTPVKAEPQPVQADTRARVVSGKEVTSIAPCWLALSDDEISVINDGGRTSVRISASDEETLESVKTSISSPDDIEVVPDDTNSTKTRRFVIVRSKSQTTGIYKITFATSCETKELSVKVR